MFPSKLPNFDKGNEVKQEQMFPQLNFEGINQNSSQNLNTSTMQGMPSSMQGMPSSMQGMPSSMQGMQGNQILQMMMNNSSQIDKNQLMQNMMNMVNMRNNQGNPEKSDEHLEEK